MPDEVAERLVRIETKLDAIRAHFDDHEARLRSLERFYWALPSSAFVLAVAALVISLLRG